MDIAMLREVKNALWTRRLTLLGWRYDFVVGRKTVGRGWRRGQWEGFAGSQLQAPAGFLALEGRCYWWFENCFYWEDEDLDAGDVLALVRDRQRRQQRKLEQAHAAMARDAQPGPRRQPITRELKLAVFERDGGRCVECRSNFDLQYDHIIPVALGGATSLENLQLLCAPCNQRKGASLG
ncbi:MAG TPA: HNH endonuclease signature motif containing protein [Solirubrobacteraceae bacterium]